MKGLRSNSDLLSPGWPAGFCSTRDYYPFPVRWPSPRLQRVRSDCDVDTVGAVLLCSVQIRDFNDVFLRAANCQTAAPSTQSPESMTFSTRCVSAGPQAEWSRADELGGTSEAGQFARNNSCELAACKSAKGRSECRFPDLPVQPDSSTFSMLTAPRLAI